MSFVSLSHGSKVLFGGFELWLKDQLLMGFETLLKIQNVVVLSHGLGATSIDKTSEAQLSDDIGELYNYY